MPYLLLGIAVLIGLYGLYHLFLRAKPEQIAAALMAIIAFIICAAIFLMAVTGRLPAAIALLTALFPLALGWWRVRKKHENGNGNTMSRSEALDILGLKDPTTDSEIDEAYRRLIQKIHPDRQGSPGLAARLNQARDCLKKGENGRD